MSGFKSLAHRRKMGELLAQGKISQMDYDAHERATPHGPLPERLPSTEGARVLKTNRGQRRG